MDDQAFALSRRSALAVLSGLAVLPSAVTPAEAADPVLIFFDWGTSKLSPSAQPLIALIKERIKARSRVTIVGHCDTSEPDPDKLSLARATQVHKALRLPGGVPVAISGKGATAPLVPTGPGKQEPRNRYAMVTVT